MTVPMLLSLVWLVVKVTVIVDLAFTAVVTSVLIYFLLRMGSSR